MTDANQPRPIQTAIASDGILKTNNNTINTVNIRSGPSLNRRVIHEGKKGDKVKILDQTKPAGDTYAWYKVKFGSQPDDIGWVREDVIELTYTNPSPASTLLLFATNSRTVRIYAEQGQIYMNVYDNRSEKTELYAVEAARLPQVDAQSKWKSYVAIKDNSAYYVRFIPFGEVDFIINNANNGNIILREKGFRASGSEYQKN
ncbi:MAG: SH3 domain-containing protein [Nostocales cyanobacterium 94392]|nr:SH3 domain-containing protein [Nostocales cyanobacterium 94392]